MNEVPHAADEELALRAQSRDPAAWSVLFETHYQKLFVYIRYRVRGADIAEDLASQVFEIAYARADTFDYRGVPFEGWLFGIARNVVRDHVKKIVRRGIDDELDETFQGEADDEIAGIDLRNDLVNAMQHLTEDQQQVLQLRFLLDRSVAETAEAMARSEDAVKNLQRRALASMARALEPGLKGGVPI